MSHSQYQQVGQRTGFVFLCILFHGGGKWKKLQTLGQLFRDTINDRENELGGDSGETAWNME